MHAGQLAVPLLTVQALIAAQFPRFARLTISPIPSAGTVNAIFRLGDDLTVRFPLEPGEADATRRSLESEQSAARELLGRTRFPTPEPVAIGEPGPGYPLPWSIQSWVAGAPATDDDPADSIPFAHDLAEFIRGVRGIDTRGVLFSGEGRGGVISAQDDWMQVCFDRSESLLDVSRLRDMWSTMRDLPRGSTPGVTTHGDLMPGNVLVAAHRLAGVIDVGGLGPADPALDLVGGWHLLDPAPRRAFRAALDCDDQEWARGRAWAFAQAMGLVWYYHRSNPTMSAIGRRTLARLAEDDAAR